jgi:sorbitol/mannitol transport system substrate-binding protein
MWSTKQLVLAAAAVCAAVAVGMVYPQAAKEELTIGTVNNADMILMQRLSKEFEKKSGIKLHWVVLGESVLRQRLTVDISTGSNTFDVITIGSYETPLWGARGWERIINMKIFLK